MSIGKLDTEADLERFVEGLLQHRLTLQSSQMASVKTSFDPEAWHTIGAAGEPAFANGWVNFGGSDQVAQFRKDAFGMVHVRGIVKNGTVGLAIFQLPAGYRPLTQQRFAVPSNNAFGYAQAASDGNVSLQVGSNAWAQLDTMKFWTD